MKKICKICKKSKTIDNFHIHRWRKDGRESRCKECRKKLDHIVYKNYRDTPEGKEKTKKYYAKNKEHLKAKAKEYADRNRDKINNRNTKWKIKNRNKCLVYNKKYYSRKRLIPAIRLNENISSQINIGFNGKKNVIKWQEYVGYKLEDLVNHLETLFKIGMSWDNHGKDGWEIDHIIPKSLWEFKSYEDREFRQCWALCNLQPLWVIDNKKKYNKCI